jgi:hypothetical protein
MTKSEIKFCALVIGIMAITFCVKEYMTIWSIDVHKSSSYLYPDGTSTVTISVLPMTRFGAVTPFRKPNVEFVIQEGKEKVTVTKRESDKLILQAKYETGVVVVLIKNKYTIIPIMIDIPIIKPTT